MKTVTYFNEIVKKETSYEKKLREQNGTVGLLFADKNKKVPNIIDKIQYIEEIGRNTNLFLMIIYLCPLARNNDT